MNVKLMVIFNNRIQDELIGKDKLLHRKLYSFDAFCYWIYFEDGVTITKYSRFLNQSMNYTLQMTIWAKKKGLVQGEKKGRCIVLTLTKKGKKFRNILLNIWNKLRGEKLT